MRFGSLSPLSCAELTSLFSLLCPSLSRAQAFTDSIISTLPIKFREEQPQRSETEKVIHVLRAHPAGLPSTLALSPCFFLVFLPSLAALQRAE